MAAKKRNSRPVLAQLEVEYRSLAPVTQRFANEIERQIVHLLDTNKIALAFPVQKRVKLWSSIAEKLERNPVPLESLLDLQYLVGLRVILQFGRDVKTVSDLLSSSLHVLKVYDTAARLREDQFGYASIHFIVELPEAWLSVPTLSDMRGMKAEIQVRTTAAHIWAAASHTLQYKQEESVPPLVRRAIYRLSALLETVDLELDRVLAERDAYRQVETADIPGTSPLNVDLIEKLLDTAWPAENKLELEDYSSLLEDLGAMGVTSVAQLSSLLDQYRDDALKWDRARVQEMLLAQKAAPDSFKGIISERLSRGIMLSHTGLARVALKSKFKDEWEAYASRKVEKASNRLLKRKPSGAA